MPEAVATRLAGKRTLLLVENVSVPLDRRVWPEALALKRAGLEVVVVSPTGIDRDQEFHERIEDVEIHRYPAQYAEGGAVSYAREYATAFRHIRRLARRLARQRSFDVVHAANPPDLLLSAARSLKRGGTRFIFDHHDLSPELYRSRFGGAQGPLYYALRALERRSYSLADVVVATNESYRRIAIERGGKRAEDVFVVRNAPNLDRFRPGEPDPALKRGKPYLLAYVGVMGAQDGVDDGLRALARLKAMRADWHAVLVGDGDVYEEMRTLAHGLGLDDHVEFTGYLLEPDVLRVLSTADVCLSPEPSSPLNDVSTMMKVAEYMAMGRPIVCFDLPESRFTAGEAALYAPPGDEEAFARTLDELLDRPDLREELGARGRARVEAELAWEHSERRLLAAYERALGLS